MSTKEVEPVVQGEVVDLVSIATEIHVAWASHMDAEDQMHEARFRIGRLLIQARAMHPSHNAFGAWLDEQGFRFSTDWARTLRRAAEHEADVRAALQTQVVNGTTNFKAAVTAAVPPPPKALNKGKPKSEPEKQPGTPEPAVFIPHDSATERIDTYSVTIKPDADLGKQILAASKKAKMPAYDWVILAVREKLAAKEEDSQIAVLKGQIDHLKAENKRLTTELNAALTANYESSGQGGDTQNRKTTKARAAGRSSTRGAQPPPASSDGFVDVLATQNEKNLDLVAPKPPERTYAKDPKDCNHNFRQRSGLCPTCGHKR